MRYILRAKGEKQRGDGFIETLVALALILVLGTGITTFTLLTMTQTGRSSIHMQAIQQLENIGYWVTRDAQMAQTVSPGPNAGFPLQLTLIDENNITSLVKYSLSGGEIQRSLEETSQTVLVAQSINPSPDLTNCSYTNGMLNFNATATVGDWSLSRTFRIKKRPG
jgi:hypothetical protein